MDSLQILKDKAEKCSFCKLKEINELKYGPLYKRNGLVAHYYCVLFSYRVIQNGADDEGILGFLVRDIRNELRRVKNIKCHYCSKPNASVYCANSQCDRIFHFPCGIMRKSLHQYKGSFKSFCSEHRPKQKIPLEYLTEAQKNTPKCVICYDEIDCNSETEVLWANCCLKTWYHRDCLQKFALSSGYLFKCAICNNRRQFKQWVEEYGIFVPKQDASWELEPNAFSELLVQHGRCDAANCLCPFGREFSSEYHTRQWDIVLCKSCGSQGIHPPCSNRIVTSNWECDLCKLVRKNLRIKRSKTSAKSKPDPCNSSQDNPMTECEDFGNVATSSYSQNLLPLDTATDEGNALTDTTERKRKRTEEEEEQSDLKKTAFESDQNQDEETQVCMEKADTAGYAHTSTSQPSFHPQEVTDDEAVDIEDVSAMSSEDDDEVVVDAPEVSYVGTSSNDDIEESKRKDQGIVIIDLTETTPVDKDEIITVMETYRTIQLSDVRYRVKKEVYVVSDDDDDEGGAGGGGGDNEGDKDAIKNDNGDENSVDSELEIILHKNNSSDSRKPSVIKDENDTRPTVSSDAPGSPDNSDVSVIAHVGGEPQDEGMTWDMETSSEDGLVKPDEQEVQVLEVPDEEEPKTEAKPKSSVKNEIAGSSSRAADTVDDKLRSELLDKYFIIFLEEKRNRSRLDRLSSDIKKVILNHNKKYGSKFSESPSTKQDEEDEESHITVSSDSESEYSSMKAISGIGIGRGIGCGRDDEDDEDDDDDDDDDNGDNDDNDDNDEDDNNDYNDNVEDVDDDDVQIIDNPSG